LFMVSSSVAMRWVKLSLLQESNLRHQVVTLQPPLAAMLVSHHEKAISFHNRYLTITQG